MLWDTPSDEELEINESTPTVETIESLQSSNIVAATESVQPMITECIKEPATTIKPRTSVQKGSTNVMQTHVEDFRLKDAAKKNVQAKWKRKEESSDSENDEDDIRSVLMLVLKNVVVNQSYSKNTVLM